jgi:hypothetical protein
MIELSLAAQAILVLHSAQKSVAARADGGSWWILDAAKWELIHALPVGAEHSFILAIIRAHNQRRMAA